MLGRFDLAISHPILTEYEEVIAGTGLINTKNPFTFTKIKRASTLLAPGAVEPLGQVRLDRQRACCALDRSPRPPLRVTKAIVSADQRSARLHVEGGRQPLHVIMVRALYVKNADGQKLRHGTFHPTLNRIPVR